MKKIVSFPNLGGALLATPWAKAERPELMKLLDNARKGDVVIVWKLDRLARSLRQLIETTARPVGFGETTFALQQRKDYSQEAALLFPKCGIDSIRKRLAQVFCWQPGIRSMRYWHS